MNESPVPRTDAEYLLCQHLRMRRLHGYKFRRQNPRIDFVAAFRCPQEKLIIEVIEIDFWEDLAEEDRWTGLPDHRVIRFSDREVATDMPRVLDEIRNALLSGGKPTR